MTFTRHTSIPFPRRHRTPKLSFLSFLFASLFYIWWNCNQINFLNRIKSDRIQPTATTISIFRLMTGYSSSTAFVVICLSNSEVLNFYALEAMKRFNCDDKFMFFWGMRGTGLLQNLKTTMWTIKRRSRSPESAHFPLAHISSRAAKILNRLSTLCIVYFKSFV